MKNLLPLSHFALLLALIAATAGCDKTEEPGSSQKAPSPIAQQDSSSTQKSEWSAHINNQPGQWVSASRSLRISFSHPVAGDIPLHTPTEGIIAIEPQVAIQTSFSDDRTLLIELGEELQRNTPYKLVVMPQKLAAIPDDLAPHKIHIQAQHQDMSLQIEGLGFVEADQAQQVTGVIKTSDSARETDVSEILAASQNGEAREIRWQHISDTEHHFTIVGISRGEKQEMLELHWDGSPIGVNKKGIEKIVIPSTSSFEVVGTIGHQTTEQYIEIRFSEPLERSQSIKGLVQIDGTAPKNTRIDGNRLLVYPRKKLSGDITLTLHPGIKSTQKIRLETAFSQQLTFLSEKPGIRFVGDHRILSPDSQPRITIEAVNVDSVQITAYRTPTANIGQFLQSSNLERRYINTQTSTLQWRKTYSLPEIPRDKWKQYDIELDSLTRDLGNDLIAIEIKIDRSNSILDCGSPRPGHDDTVPQQNWPSQQSNDVPAWVNNYYHSQGYASWRDRDDPCKDYYFRYNSNHTSSLRYFTVSNIGLIAKMAANREMSVVVTDINTAEPLKNAEVTAYNFQHQIVAEVETDKHGIARFAPASAPFYLIARYKNDQGFLRLVRNEALSTNVFDTGGTSTSSGIKGFFYGERGVWRPGDDIFLTFIVQDKSGSFPANYPLTLDFFDPRGNKQDSITQASPLNGFYHYKLKTQDSSPTGNWRAVIKYGNQYFDKLIPVEAIVPNRLKIDLGLPDRKLTKEDDKSDFTLSSQWLNGATASDLKADIKMRASKATTRIAGFDAYIFDDPTRELGNTQRTIFEGKLDSNGKADFNFSPSIHNPPGEVKLNFTARVFEKSGNFSTQYFSKNYLPYKQLAGMKIPQGSGWNDSISRTEKHAIQFLSVDSEGERIANSKLNFTLYRVSWRWWWDYSDDNISNYINSSHSQKLADVDLVSDANGQAEWELNGEDYDWGRYLLRVCDAQSNHCAGKIVYMGWSYTANKNPSGDTQLILSTDKKHYEVGDTAYLTLPQVLPKDTANARFLLTLETGSRILSQRWVDDDIRDNKLPIKLTSDMTPNVYAHLTLIQGTEGKGNDSPVRLYGISPILVNNPESKLEPQIETEDMVKPESTMHISVSEKAGRAMTYTLAVVDEGLLGITNYHAPNPHQKFYQREALGVLTWDLYDLIPNANANSLNSAITLGGSDNESDEAERRKKRRFPPVVRFIGPFTLEEGEDATHDIELPEYMGAVRVMVVAGDHSRQGEEAYGVASKTVTVTQPLTLLATLPRVLGPGEQFTLPVNVFANSPEIRKVIVTATSNEYLVNNTGETVVHFDRAGDKIVNLDFNTISSIGTGEVTITATSGNEVASQTIHIPIRTANQPEKVAESGLVKAGESLTLNLTPNGLLNTNKTYLEISRLPDANLSERLDYLIGYPHGCLEQTTSRLFPQIFLNNLVSLSDEQAQEIEYHVQQGIEKFKRFQTAEGSFNYWPGGRYVNTWANNYAGHLLLEARQQGYAIPSGLLDKWIKSQKKAAAKLSGDGYEATDAYTLYTLALANEADFSAMNRLRQQLVARKQSDNNNRVARWLLAAAYAHAGVKDAASELMALADNTITDYDWAGYTYGSHLRDEALYLLANKTVGNEEAAWQSVLSIVDKLGSGHWYSTQSTAWALLGLSRFYEDQNADPVKFSYRINDGDWQSTTLVSPIFKQEIKAGNTPIKLEIKNESEGNFYALLGNIGIPANSQEQAHASKVSLNISYKDMEGNALDIAKLQQGTDFQAVVTVKANDRYARYENLALTMTMPSGWQIANDRLEGKEQPVEIEYLDIRDDRVLSYFTLGRYYYYHWHDSREVALTTTLNASFKGRFYLPGWHVESMYDKNISASTVGHWVEVVD